MADPAPTHSLGDGTVLVHLDGAVATVTLNRPERLNAADARMWSGIAESMALVAATPEVRAVVLQGAGRAFCAGADLAAGAGAAAGAHHSDVDTMRRVGAVCLAVHELAVPMVARVQGPAVGAGWNLALACDLVVAGRSATFSQIFARRGLSVDFGGSWLLPRLVGLQRAKELVLLADMLDAEAAHRLGLVTRVVDDELLDAEVDAVVRKLVDGPPIALAASKRLLNAGPGSSLSQALEAETFVQAANLRTDDVAEAFVAFVERRAPRFEGR
jgi:2-(1,2-epoxy-1,2-dihydrophenyl)acetyl-CoA isomerase